jgi:hypothetical protein
MLRVVMLCIVMCVACTRWLCMSTVIGAVGVHMFVYGVRCLMYSGCVSCGCCQCMPVCVVMYMLVGVVFVRLGPISYPVHVMMHRWAAQLTHVAAMVSCFKNGHGTCGANS